MVPGLRRVNASRHDALAAWACCYPAAMSLLVAGDEAPDFEAVDTEGQAVHLRALAAEGPVIVAFFPRAFTPG